MRNIIYDVILIEMFEMLQNLYCTRGTCSTITVNITMFFHLGRIEGGGGEEGKRGGGRGRERGRERRGRGGGSGEERRQYVRKKQWIGKVEETSNVVFCFK